MSLFTPTAFYFGQPIVTGPTALYKIRTDANASSVTIAMPGTQFGSEFGQSSYRSDISGYINGGSSLPDLPLTGSGQTTSTTTKFTDAADGYTTSMDRPNDSNMGCLPGNASNVNFGTSPFTIEAWFNAKSGTADSWTLFNYNAGCGFFGWSSAGYYRWVIQNASFGETLTDYTSTLTNNTWNHIFLSRDATYWYGGLNGTIRARMTLSGATGTSAGFQICGWKGATMRPTLFQDFRVTKGVCRYAGTVGSSYTQPDSIVTRI